MAIGAYARGFDHGDVRRPRSAAALRVPARRSAAAAPCCWSALLVGALLAALAGLLVGLPSLRLRGDYLAIVTLGFGEIIRVVILNIDAIGGARGLLGHPAAAPTSSGSTCSRRSRSSGRVQPGRTRRSAARFLAIREDEIAAEAMGVDTTRDKVIAFVVSSALRRHRRRRSSRTTCSTCIPNSFTFIKSIEIIIMVVSAAWARSPGAVLGAVALHRCCPRCCARFAQYRMVALLAAAHRADDHAAAGPAWAPRVRCRRSCRSGGAGERRPPPELRRSDGRCSTSHGVTMRFGGLKAVSDLSLSTSSRASSSA